MDFDLEDIAAYLDFFNGIEDEEIRKDEYNELLYVIGHYRGLKKKWEDRKAEGYQQNKKTVKRLYEAELKKQINITKKFLIRTENDIPLVIDLPTISEESRIEINNYLHDLEEININKKLNAVFNDTMPTKKAVESHIRDIFKTYSLVGIEDVLRDLLPKI
jgi:hypothetical protein